MELSGTSAGDKASYICNTGFMISGDRIRDCLDNGHWSSTAPTCERKYMLILLKKNLILYLLSVQLPSVQTSPVLSVGWFVSCQQLWVLKQRMSASVDSFLRVLVSEFVLPMANGRGLSLNVLVSLYSVKYICFKFLTFFTMFVFLLFSVVDCGRLTDPENGQVIFADTRFGFRARYRCFSGYTLQGETSRLCEDDGFWTGSSPICVREYRIVAILHTSVILPYVYIQ